MIKPTHLLPQSRKGSTRAAQTLAHQRVSVQSAANKSALSWLANCYSPIAICSHRFQWSSMIKPTHLFYRRAAKEILAQHRPAHISVYQRNQRQIDLSFP